MVKLAVRNILVLLGAACSFSAASAAEVKEVRVTGKADDVRIEVVSDFPIRYTHYTMSAPPRGIIHIIGAEPGQVEPVTDVREGPLSRVVVTKKDLKSMMATRVVAELRKEVDLVTETSDGGRRLTVSFAPLGAGGAAKPARRQGEPGTEPNAAPAAAVRERVAAKPPVVPHVRGVRINGRSVEIVGTGIEAYKAFTLDGPNRLILDFAGARNGVAAKKIDIPHSKVRRCRLGEIPGRLRLVFDLVDGSGPQYSVEKIESGLRITFP
ncbi:AMIN domain-containing protein [Geobacter sp. DSM 9736]|uniref:AMIN domain-containing protein n=1 Tax=Geobacter sp. DSM 9736 TaxID=1277350 RepID=UPI000B51189D|nr:AMIN domain-containing protein [Geobacter sp. DSM 9736]SNB44967.1 AMIN domain-containing protein [Geobacter sp. DSM 9736]